MQGERARRRGDLPPRPLALRARGASYFEVVASQAACRARERCVIPALGLMSQVAISPKLLTWPNLLH